MPHYTIDSQNYIQQAQTLKNGGYNNYFPNGYPLIILIVSMLFPLLHGLLWLNIILSLFTIIFVYLIAEKLSGNIYIGLFSSAVLVFYPTQVNYVHFILTEVPVTFFLALAVYLYQKEKLIYSGLALGFAIIIRTTLIFVPFLFFIYLYYNHRRREGLIWLTSFLIIPLLLMLYGYLVSGNFTLGRNFTHNLYITIHQPYKLSYTKIHGIESYFSYMISSPVHFLTDRIHSIWNLWGFLPSTADGFRTGIIYKVYIALRFPLLILAIYGYIKSDSKRIPLLLILPAISITLIHTIFFSNTRFTLPAEPMLIILAVMGISKFITSKLGLRSDIK
ncbi:MAG: glycosyltransferase family 39 protein [Ignavibacteriaceae bacterium]|nr:glycosyltransferase family 39 protein [Ignavibacteriaceae bacterium]